MGKSGIGHMANASNYNIDCPDGIYLPNKQKDKEEDYFGHQNLILVYKSNQVKSGMIGLHRVEYL